MTERLVKIYMLIWSVHPLPVRFLLHPSSIPILTARDVPDVNFPSLLGPTDRRIFAKDKVHMVGDRVAAVAAETEELEDRLKQLGYID